MIYEYKEYINRCSLPRYYVDVQEQGPPTSVTVYYSFDPDISTLHTLNPYHSNRVKSCLSLSPVLKRKKQACLEARLIAFEGGDQTASAADHLEALRAQKHCFRTLEGVAKRHTCCFGLSEMERNFGFLSRRKGDAAQATVKGIITDGGYALRGRMTADRGR